MSKLMLAAALAAATLVAAAAASGDNGKTPKTDAAVTYGIIGDTPYGAPQIANFPNDVAQINADPDVSLVLHLGDIKNGSSQCTDAYFDQIFADFEAFTDPLVYTPGDNEWTDCHRANNGGYVPTERLAKLRSLFFATPGVTLGAAADVEAEAAPYVENVTWNASQVQFGTLDVPGSNNDWLPWFSTASPPPQPTDPGQIAEYTARDAADLEWLRHIFFEAKRQQSVAVVLGIQADMWDPAFSGPNDAPSQYDHFTDLVQALAKEAQTFHRPVLLLNGDSHEFVDDRPLAADAPAYQLSMYGLAKPADNLRRITVNGSTTPCHEYLRLTIDPTSASVFSYTRVRFANQPGFPASCTAS
jgi:Calcineurin-like phosphoesterase